MRKKTSQKKQNKSSVCACVCMRMYVLKRTTGPGIPRNPSEPGLPGAPWGPTGPVLPCGPSRPDSP